uniref:Alternative protein PAQR5 n=1 Tax=Homo sapiens TaxID=9606 RepID=L8E9R0_HUMAN|nr:alternative protein PAQR5 [Homo sapiens]
MILIQEGQRPNLKNCWCYMFQKALDLSALFRLISSFSNSPTKA